MSQAMMQVCQRGAYISSLSFVFRGISTTAILSINKRSGVPKVTRFRTKPLTYEQATPPSKINVRKGFLSWNTSNLHEEKRQSQTAFEDFIIRKFMAGTWHGGLSSEVAVKRKHNTIILAFLVNVDRLLPRQIYFLQGYTEELLSHWFKCPVKVELSTISSGNDVIFKHI